MTEMHTVDEALFENLATDGLSFVLGWEIDGSSASLYLEVALLPTHPQHQPYDQRKQVACYRLARLTLEGISEVTGIDGDQPLIWDDARGEFEEVDEIFDASCSNGALTLMLSDRDLNIRCRRAELTLMSGDGPDAFSPKWPTSA